MASERYTFAQRWADARAANPREVIPRVMPWGRAIAYMAGFLALLFAVQAGNYFTDYEFNAYGLRPRTVDGLWGVLTMPFLHANWLHLLANSGPFLIIGWVVLLAGWRVFSFVTLTVIIVGGLLTWVIGPSNTIIVGASGLVFGWMGYIVARALFSRRIAWIATAVVVLVLFGTMFGSLIPQTTAHSGIGVVSWQAHLAGFLAGLAVGWLLHPRKSKQASLRFRRPTGGPTAASGTGA